MTPLECRLSIIRPTLKMIDMWSEAAEDLLLGTALQESRLIYTHQLGGGPALGYWQMEPATHDDIWQNWLRYRNDEQRLIVEILGDKAPMQGTPRASLLETEHPYACAMARIKYRRSPQPLPAHGDVVGYAKMWKSVYNSAGGAGNEVEFIANWNRAVEAPGAGAMVN